MKHRVYLCRAESYREEELLPKIETVFETFGLFDRLRPGMTVVLKPNLILRGDPERAAITHPAFTEAVGKCVQKAGASVLIAESPGGPYSPGVMRAHFRACGYTDMAERNGFSLYTDCKSREVSLPRGQRCQEAPIVEPFLTGDFLIDLPKVKTHCMVGYSGAVKNLFGCVPGLQKPELHCRFPQKEDFSRMLTDLCERLMPGFTLMDGVWAMEGDGPTGGERRDLGLIAAAENPFAADVAVSALLGMDPESILTLQNGAERGLGPKNLEAVELLGEPFESLYTPDFKKARAASTDFIDRAPKALRPMLKKLATPSPKIDPKICVGCGKCAESCPQKAIEIIAGKAKIDRRRCIRCFCCHEMCPRRAVDIRRLGLLKL